MTRLEKIERELRAFGALSVRIRPADNMIPRLTFSVCRGHSLHDPVGNGDTLEEAYADLLDKQGDQVAA